MFRPLLVLILAITAVHGTGAAAAPLDIALLLDNSSSMKTNDPRFAAKYAAVEFIDMLPPGTRVAILAFDSSSRLISPITPVTGETKPALAARLEKLDYTGRFSNGAAAVERAIYELKTNGRAEAQKSIIFLTDGRIETGNPTQDVEFSKWLRDILADEAAGAKIRVFGIAFTEAADIHALQTLAHKTGARYYRAPQAKDLRQAFQEAKTAIATAGPPPIRSEPKAPAAPSVAQSERPSAIQTPSEREIEPQPPAGEPPSEPATQAASATPPQPKASAPIIDRLLERLRENLAVVTIVGGVIILGLLGAMAVGLRQPRAARTSSAHGPVRKAGVYTPPAMLEDLSGITRRQTYDITGKVTWISRAIGEGSTNVRTIVIRDDLISRDHAVIQYKNHGYWIADRGSVNGTYVNDQPLTSEKLLRQGDVIRFAKFEFKFVMPQRQDLAQTVMVKRPSEQAAGIAGASGAQTAASDDRHPRQESTDTGQIAKGKTGTEEIPAANNPDGTLRTHSSAVDGERTALTPDTQSPSIEPANDKTTVRPAK